MADAPQPPEPLPQTGDPNVTPGMTITPAGAPRAAEDRVSTLDIPVPAEPATPPQPTAPPPSQPSSPPQQAVTLPPTPEPMPVQPTTTLAQQPDMHASQFSAAEEDGSIRWTASEFIAHEKSPSWYGALAGVAILAASIIFVLAKDVISSVVVIVCALAFGFYGSRQPRQLQYVVNDHGIGVGERFLPYDTFRSFTVLPDGAFSSIIFMPLKRFATTTTIYYAPEHEDAIVELLADRLPYEEHTPDAVDRLMRRIRF